MYRNVDSSHPGCFPSLMLPIFTCSDVCFLCEFCRVVPISHQQQAGIFRILNAYTPVLAYWLLYLYIYIIILIIIRFDFHFDYIKYLYYDQYYKTPVAASITTLFSLRECSVARLGSLAAVYSGASCVAVAERVCDRRRTTNPHGQPTHRSVRAPRPPPTRRLGPILRSSS